MDNLVEPSVEPGQGIGDAVGRGLRRRSRRVHCGSGQARLGVRMGHAFELPRQRVETFIDGGKVPAKEVLVVINLAG